jgi:hypothetical protein
MRRTDRGDAGAASPQGGVLSINTGSHPHGQLDSRRTRGGCPFQGLPVSALY